MPTATTPHIAFPTNIKSALLLAQPFTPKQRCTLGNEEAMARKNARSDRVSLDFLGTFFIKPVRQVGKKGTKRTICKNIYFNALKIPTAFYPDEFSTMHTLETLYFVP
jgi:hypothetical protein